MTVLNVNLNQHGKIKSRVTFVMFMKSRNIPCGECKQKFDSFDEMDLHHYLVHGRDGEFACDKCGKILNSADSVRFNMERVHGGDGEYACDKCGKTLNLPDSLGMHMILFYQPYGTSKSRNN